jgi:hypothetical protein
MSAYIYSGLHTGESEAYQVALSNYLEVFKWCSSGDYASTGYVTESEQERVRNIAINPTGSGYNVFNGTTSGTGWYEVRITPSLNPDYSPTVVGVGCTRAEANDDFLLASGEASQGNPDCPICLSIGSMSQSGVFQTPIEATYIVDFKWEIEYAVHEYTMTGICAMGWCDEDAEPECSGFGLGVLTGWTTISSGTETSVLGSGDTFGGFGFGYYSGVVAGWTANDPSVDVSLGASGSPAMYNGQILGDGEDGWTLQFSFGNMPTVYNNINSYPTMYNARVGTHYYSGDYRNCLEPTNSNIPTGELISCYANTVGGTHPSDTGKAIGQTWRFKVTEASVSRQGDNGSNIFPNPDIHHFVTSGQFSSPSICDVYKYFHYYDCLDIQSIQSSSSLDNCQVLEALEAAPESGHRVKMPCTSWDWMMTGSFWSRPASPLSGSCTVSSLGSGVSLAYASFGDGMCGALVMRNDDSGDWTEIGGPSSIGHWSGLTYIDNQGCSGCFIISGSGHKPEPGIFSGCSGYNACVDASGHYAGC